jgi:hypothetical protein
MLYARRQERALLAGLPAQARQGRSGVLALAVLGVLLWPATVATSATAGRPVGHPTATMSPAVEQAVLGNSGPVSSRLLLARRAGRPGHGPIPLGVLAVAAAAVVGVAGGWRWPQVGPVRRRQPTLVRVRAPPLPQPS